MNNDEYDYGHNAGHYLSDGEGDLELLIQPINPMKAIYIKASWCAPCKAALPKFIAECERLDIPHEILDADEDEARIASLGVRSVPTIILVHLDSGEEITRGRAEEIIPLLKDYR